MTLRRTVFKVSSKCTINEKVGENDENPRKILRAENSQTNKYTELHQNKPNSDEPQENGRT